MSKNPQKLDNPPHPPPITTLSACRRQTAAGGFKRRAGLLTVTWADRRYPTPELGQRWSDRCTCLIGEVGTLTLSGRTHTHIPALYSGTKPGDNPSNAVTLRRFPHCNPACRLGKHTHTNACTQRTGQVWPCCVLQCESLATKEKDMCLAGSMSHGLSRRHHRAKVKEAWRGRGGEERTDRTKSLFSWRLSGGFLCLMCWE